jgi:hypothetical protein
MGTAWTMDPRIFVSYPGGDRMSLPPDKSAVGEPASRGSQKVKTVCVRKIKVWQSGVLG